MSVASYSDLITAIQTWLLNTTISGNADDFLKFGQLRIFRELRIASMESTLNVAIVSTGVDPTPANIAPLPSDYLELKMAYVDSSPTVKLQRRTADWIYEHYPVAASQSGKPKFIARLGSNFIFGPYPDSNYTIGGIYYAQPVLLSSNNPTNWFTTNAADLLLFAALIEATPFLKNDERIPMWEAKYQKIRDDIQARDNAEYTSGSDIHTSFSPMY